MKRPKPDFKKRNDLSGGYDLNDDWSLIEASLAKQYGIRIRQHTDMPWTEFCTLVGGLMHDTPLGAIVSIRLENDPKVIKSFNSEQKRIYRAWQLRLAQNKLNNPEKLEKEFEQLGQLFKKMFHKKEVK